MSVYKPCDIRGPVGALSPALYASWGGSIGRRLHPGDVVYVGGDVRPSTPAFLEALVDGLASAGVQVRNLGIVPTPQVYFAARHYRASGCAVVTASHSPPGVNGLKWALYGEPPTEALVQAFRKEAESGQERPAVARGAVERVSVDGAYVDALAATLEAAYARSGATPALVQERASAQTVVLDPGNGCWSGRAGVWLRRLVPAARVLAIHDRPDGTFPERSPDSSRRAHLAALCTRVRAEQADLGIAFDGDGDRVAFVDGTGTVLTAEQATWVLLRETADRVPGHAVVLDVKFSDRMAEAVVGYGGTPVIERSGHAFLRRRMQERQAVFGAEVSGHYFYEDLDGGDDGFYAAVRLLGYLLASDQSLAALRAACPPVYLTPDLRVAVPYAEQADVIDRARRAFADYPTRTVDGLRVDLPGGWALMRASVTEPALTFRFEGDTPEALDRTVEAVCGLLGPMGDIVRATYGRVGTGVD